jgi:cytochrome c oxidase cbb3-type subunit 3
MSAMRRRFVSLLFVALAACTHAPDSTPTPTHAADAQVAKVTPTSPPDARPSRVAMGNKLYQTYCALCHGADAKGYVADHAPSLVSKTFQESADDTFLRASIALGRPGTSMAAYAKSKSGPLSDDEILQIIAWLRSQTGVEPAQLDLPRRGDATRGQALFAKNCQVCHGDATTRGPEVWLANPVFLELASDPFLRYAIAEGRPGTKMEKWGDKLGAQDLDDLVVYLRSLAPATGVANPSTPNPPLPPLGPIVLNPKGKAPTFTLDAAEKRYVPAAEVKKALDEKRKLIIVDARPPSDWQAMHIPGAISIPYYDMSRIADLPKDGTWILTYCACPHHASGIVLDELRKQGFTNTAVIDEGILFWSQQGYPIDGTAPPQVPKAPQP